MSCIRSQINKIEGFFTHIAFQRPVKIPHRLYILQVICQYCFIHSFLCYTLMLVCVRAYKLNFTELQIPKTFTLLLFWYFIQYFHCFPSSAFLFVHLKRESSQPKVSQESSLVLNTTPSEFSLPQREVQMYSCLLREICLQFSGVSFCLRNKD